MINISLCIFIARLKLGYFPTYGDRADPTALGLDFFSYTGIALLIISIPTSITWIFTTFHGLYSYGKRFKINWYSTLSFLFGILLYVYFNTTLIDVYMWYND